MGIIKKRHISGLFFVIVLLYIVFGMYRELRVTELEYYNSKIPPEFDGYKIIQISDLHCALFGAEQEQLVQSIATESPDVIVITGDMFDKKRWNADSIQMLLAGISEVAPIYAITGNNEYDDRDMYASLMDMYEEFGVEILSDETVEIRKGEARIFLSGAYYRSYIALKNFFLEGKNNQFDIVLYHDPSQFEKLGKKGFDLVLAGHTHGGIIRLPLVGGLISNAGGFFPKYDYGMFYSDTCDMFVSTGLGNLEIPRFYNRPELVSITLKTQ